MQFVRHGDWFKVVRVSGPEHHLLGLRFGASADFAGVDARIIREVHEGVDRGNRAFGTDYAVAAIEVARGDQYVQGVYRELAYRLVDRLVSNGTFQRAA